MSTDQPTDYAVVCAMERYGGHFIQILAQLCHRADPVNFAKIKAAWPEYWREYSETAKMLYERGEGPR